MSLATYLLKALFLLKAKLKYMLFNVNSVVVLNLMISNDVYVEHPEKGLVNLSYFLNSVHENLTEDVIYTLVSYDGIQYKMLKTIKNLEDQNTFIEKFFLDNTPSLPKYLMALHPFKKTFFHKHIVLVGA